MSSNNIGKSINLFVFKKSIYRSTVLNWPARKHLLALTWNAILPTIVLFTLQSISLNTERGLNKNELLCGLRVQQIKTLLKIFGVLIWYVFMPAVNNSHPIMNFWLYCQLFVNTSPGRNWEFNCYVESFRKKKKGISTNNIDFLLLFHQTRSLVGHCIFKSRFLLCLV